jgi:predicted nucleic acid-binding Zn ribbon protein
MKHDSTQSKICTINNIRLLNILTSDATVTCSKCGAKAHDPASLCSPVQLTGSG